MKWFKRLFGKQNSSTKQEPQVKAPAEEPVEPVETDEPAETAASVVDKAEEPPAEKAEIPVEDAVPAAEPSDEPSDPALSQLDSERAAARLPETDEPAAEVADEPVAEVVEELAADEPVAEEAPPAEPAPVADAPEAPAAEEGPFGPGSAKPLEGGAAPGEEYTVKGKRSSKLFHTAESPYFGRTKADVWFKTPADAENAGFAAWNHKKKAAAK